MSHPARRARKLVFLISLGVATNLAVAWGCSALASHLIGTLRVDYVLETVAPMKDGDQRLTCRMFSSGYRRTPGVEIYSWGNGGRITPNPGFPQAKPLDDPRIPAWSCIHDAEKRDACEHDTSWPFLTIDWRAGWPLTTLRGRLTPTTLGALWYERTQCREGMLRFRDSVSRIQTGTQTSLSGYLFPLIPVWPGFIFNSALYSLAWTFVLVGMMQLRIRRRHRLGLCPACAYDLRATPPNSPCPECGRPSSSP